jgi:hypothetical protein
MLQVFNPTLLTGSDYTLVAPFDCDFFRVINTGGGTVIFNERAVGGQDIPIAGGGVWEGPPEFARHKRDYRYPVGTVIGYFRAQGSSFSGCFIHVFQ